MASLGATLIVKDEVQRVATLIKALESLDAIYIVVSDKTAYNALKKLQTDTTIVKYRAWTDDFAAARNYCLSLVETDFFCWVDSDDIIKPVQRLKEVANSMQQENVDVVYFPYHYKIDEHGHTVNYQWRERMVRTSLKGEWKGAVHETFVPDVPLVSEQVRRLDVIEWIHIQEEGDEARSTARNHKILTRLYNQDPKDPRDIYYYAISLFGQEQWDEAIKAFLEFIPVSGWDEERYYAWCYIAEASIHKEAYDRAISACFGAIQELPHYPDAYYILQQIYYEVDDYKKSLEWYALAESKPQPQTNRVIDPTVKAYRASFQAAVSLLAEGEIDTAYKLITKVRGQVKDKDVETLYPEFVQAYYAKQVIEKADWLASTLHKMGEDGSKILQALPGEIQLDPRFNETRKLVIPAKTWPKKSIVFYCGKGLETWGPDTLDKGMGGSEEAVVYLSRELAKQGWRVVVYNGREAQYHDVEKGTGIARVLYLPYQQFNPLDKFDVLVAWRAPSFHRLLQTKARIRAIDMHDTPGGHQAISEQDMKYIDKVFLKSKFQRSWCSEIPDDKIAVISNGVVSEQFKGDVERQPHKVIYGSSADRGLNILCEIWPDVLKEVPDAELVWAYGWNSFDKMHAKNNDMMKWKWQVIRQMNDVGCKSLGRLSHEALAREFMSSSVWAYPTAFPEINCITAIKAGVAGCIPITTGYAALQETVLEKQKDWGEQMYDKDNSKVKADFTKRLITALKEGRDETTRELFATDYIKQFDWHTIGAQWNNALTD